jgi:hypothetical protein
MRRSDEARRERRLSLDAVAKNASHVWQWLPTKFTHSKEFILWALNQSPQLPPKAEFERLFPKSLRMGRDVVLAFCHRPDFADTLCHDRHLFVPDCWKDDKEVMLAYCSKSPRSLQECSEALCDDSDVVMAAIQLDGLELQYASAR